MFENSHSYKELLLDILKGDMSLTKPEFANQLGLSLKTLYNILEGGDPSKQTIQRINNYLRGRYGVELTETPKGIQVIKAKSVNIERAYTSSTHNENVSDFLIRSLEKCEAEMRQLREENVKLRVDLARSKKD